MNRKTLIKKTIENLSRLPNDRLLELSEYTEFVLKNIEDRILKEGISKMAADSESFEYLEREEDIYKVNDLKERYK